MSRAEVYQQRRTVHEQRAADLGRTSSLLSNLRGVSFAVFVLAGLFSLFGSAGSAGAVLSLIGAVAFGFFVVRHGRVLELEQSELRMVQVNANGEARTTGRWRELPDTGEDLRPPGHPYADDLDVFGRASLFQRLCVAHTRYGQNRLRDYLIAGSDARSIAERQSACRALAPELDLRQRLEALSLALVERAGGKKAGYKPPPDPEPLLNWAESEPELKPRALIRVGAYLFPALTIAAMVWSGSFGGPAWTISLAALGNFAVLYLARGATTRAFMAVSEAEGSLVRYGAMLAELENLQVESELIGRLKEQLMSGAARPSQAMAEFRRKVGWFELRHNGLAHPFANLLLLWDVHCTLALETWQVRSGKAARGWFKALGEIEALSSLAGYAHDEPHHCYPELVAEGAAFEAEALGHPLIDAAVRVTNDVTIPGPGHALLVTGSNMSGKSTFLRSVGLATVMAQAGGAVCARSLRLAELRIQTSIRISDSLESGVSHFYAELKKLKAVLDATESRRHLLFLLDEILHGTNSRERQIGARWIIAELLRRGAMGIVTTHDMGLCQLPPELMTQVELVHFRENMQDGQMTFDYRLRPGPVTAGNALRLMQTIGIGVPLE